MPTEALVRESNPCLPEPLRGSDPDSFAFHTISVRLPNIARRVLTETDWSVECATRLRALVDEMPYGRLRFLQDEAAPDSADWVRHLTPYLGQNWLQPPWFVVEIYFFRRILEATGYFQPGLGGGVDPYRPQKRQGLVAVEESLRPLCAQLDALQAARPESPKQIRDMLTNLLHINIWGNQADLSLWPAGDDAQPDRPHADQLNAHLLDDDAPAASYYLVHRAEQPARVDFVLDNGGVELAYDLALADYLIKSQAAGKVQFHLKPHPTYVSDATVQDVLDMVGFLDSAADPAVKRLAQRLRGHLEDGSLILQDHFFWTSPLSGWEMPIDLQEELRASVLLVSKGDANYRRWMGDRHWPFTTPLMDVLGYLPAPLVALRVLKSNVMLGLQPGEPQAITEKDPRWLYDGKWGVIQFVEMERMEANLPSN